MKLWVLLPISQLPFQPKVRDLLETAQIEQIRGWLTIVDYVT